MKNLKKLALTTSLLVFVILLSLKTFASPTPTITVSPNVLFGLPSNSTTINFSRTETFGSMSLTNDFWFFDTIGFQPDNANITVTNFLVDEKLTFTLTAPSGNTSTTKIHVANRGEPTTVTGATSWNYNDTTKIVTITVLHSSPEEVELAWITTVRAYASQIYIVVPILTIVFLAVIGVLLISAVTTGGSTSELMILAVLIAFAAILIIVYVGITESVVV